LKFISRYNLHYISIDANRLEILARNPADTRKRAIWADDINKRYGTVTKFVLKELLRWTPVDPDATRPVFKCHSSIPLSDSRDYQISINNWPYGFEDGIVHLLVWSKPRFKVDEVKGDLIPESRQLVEDFVNRTFIKRLAEDVGEENAKQRVLWFKNWTELQSVPGTDHIHILVKDATPELMKEWTRETSTHD